jgi:superfamily I DNA/RNA helicase
MLTDQQANIITAVSSGQNVQGVAGAGCGKTFLLEEFIKANSGASGIALAFGSAIAKELQSRIPEGLRWGAKTTHSFGKSALTGRFKIDAHGTKIRDAFKRLYGEGIESKYSRSITALASKLRDYAFGFPEGLQQEDIPDLISDSDLDIPYGYEGLIVDSAIQLVESLDADRTILDFADMLRQPLLQRTSFPKVDFILIDELQDWSVLQRLLLAKAVKSNPKVVLLGVGDPKQAIFAFRGADAASFEKTQEAFNMAQMPLNKTWRCPIDICNEANEIYPDSLVPMSTQRGVVRRIPRQNFDKAMLRLNEDTAILCRTNAPLLRLACSFIQKRIPVKLNPRFSQSLSWMITRTKAETLPALKTSLLESMTRDLSYARSTAVKASITDKYDSIFSCMEYSSSVDDVKALLKSLTTCKTGVQLSTIHGFKGCEAKDVYVLRPDLCPHPMAESSCDLQQEKNLLYVAVTRSLHRLTYIDE